MPNEDPAHTSFWSLPLTIQWRKALVSLPRIVPMQALRYTSPQGPQPFVLSLPSRGKHLIPVYVFVPPPGSYDTRKEGLPVILDFHGGGFVLGSCLEQAPFCAQLARELGAVVITVDYRMGPIDKFPAAIDDGEDILSAVLDASAPGHKELRAAIWKKVLEDERELQKKKSGAKKSEEKTTDTEVTDGENTDGEKKNGKKKKKSEGKKDAAQKKAEKAERAEMKKRQKREPCPESMLDTNRIALSGFSSGGNLALNLVLSVPPTSPYTTESWPTRFGETYQTPIPVLLYYPSFDCRQLPSERPSPPGLSQCGGFWSEANDLLMPTYLPRNQAAHPRASPGLAEIKDGGLHAQAKIQLVLPELDSLSEQSELWVKKMETEGRGDDLQVDRYQGVKHGWTQMPESWLGDLERSTRGDAFSKTVEFTRVAWKVAYAESTASSSI